MGAEAGRSLTTVLNQEFVLRGVDIRLDEEPNPPDDYDDGEDEDEEEDGDFDEGGENSLV